MSKECIHFFGPLCICWIHSRDIKVNEHVSLRFLKGSEAKQVTKSRYVCTPEAAFPARLLLALHSAVHEHTSEFQKSLRARKKKKKSYVNITIDRTAV